MKDAEIEIILREFIALFKKSILIYANFYKNKKTGKDTLSDSDLVKNLKIEIRDERLVVSVAQYLIFIENGRQKGKFAPVSSILLWMKEKNIRPKDNSMTINQLAFLLNRSIKELGISKRPFMSKAFENASKQLDKKINGYASAIANDLLIRFTKNKK
jgi:hypothetical protein